MKKVLVSLIILFSIIFVGCRSNMSTLSGEQQNAVKNNIEFIKKSSFASKSRMDTEIVKFENATKDTWDFVFTEDNSKIAEAAVDLTDWVITIGDTSEHDFAVIVCDSSTHEVIGYIPIK